MSWEISHSSEAWECFRRGLEAQTKEWLAEAITEAEQQVHDEAYEQLRFEAWNDDEEDPEETPFDFDGRKSELQSYMFAHDTLVNMACEHTERHRTCSNGGGDFYVDEGGFYSICLSDYEESDNA